MLRRTHTAVAPWTIVRTDNKKKARLNIIRHLLREIGAPDVAVGRPDEKIIFRFEPEALADGRLQP